jgi:hypothetical protein
MRYGYLPSWASAGGMAGECFDDSFAHEPPQTFMEEFRMSLHENDHDGARPSAARRSVRLWATRAMKRSSVRCRAADEMADVEPIGAASVRAA